jgi:hypothetical protein
MIRRCDGRDVNLLKEATSPGGFVDVSKGEAPEYVPCDCGKLFDDVYYSVIFPHRPIGGSRLRLSRSGRSGWVTKEV